MYQTDGAGEIRPYSFICSEAGMDRQPALLSGTQFLWQPYLDPLGYW